MVSSPLADMLIRVKNGYLARKAEVVVPWSKIKEAVAKVLCEGGYLSQKTVKADGVKKSLILTLRYDDKKPALNEVKIVSHPSLRVYVKKDQLPKVLNGLGLAVVSTPVGVLSGQEAAKKGLGGEVICEVW